MRVCSNRPPLERKSGIPAAVDIPAPVINIIFLNVFDFRPFIISSYLLGCSSSPINIL
jgi:hypothetical protein